MSVLQSEWTKLRSVRSTIWSLTAAAAAIIGLGIFMGARWAHQQGPIDPGFDPTNVSLSGVYIAQIIIGALGVLTISSEYATGMIRASLSTVPQRRTMLAAKLAVLAGTTIVISELAAFSAFGLCQALLVTKQAGAFLHDPGVVRAVAGSGLYLTAAAVLGFGLGAAVRHTAGAISAFFGVLFAPSAIVDLLPTDWRNDVIEYMPANAGSQIFTINQVKGGLAPWTGLGVFCLYAFAAVLVAFWLLDRRDA